MGIVAPGKSMRVGSGFVHGDGVNQSQAAVAAGFYKFSVGARSQSALAVECIRNDGCGLIFSTRMRVTNELVGARPSGRYRIRSGSVTMQRLTPLNITPHTVLARVYTGARLCDKVVKRLRKMPSTCRDAIERETHP